MRRHFLPIFAGIVSSSGNPFSYLPNAQIWHWPELLPSAFAEVTTSYSFIVGFLWSPLASPSVLSVCLDHSLCVQSFNLFNDSLELSSSEASFAGRPFSPHHRLLCSCCSSCSQTYIRATGTAQNSICHVHAYRYDNIHTYICVYIRICKKPFFDVVVLCSGNKKQTKKQERGIPLSSPSRVLECRVLPAGCCHRHSTLSLLCSYIRLRPA